MKQILYIFILLTITSCGAREIPEGELKSIIGDAVLSDITLSYVAVDNEIKRDSVRYFEPILSKYGYTYDDWKYTLEKLSYRKSSILPGIMDELALDFLHENQWYRKRDSLQNIWDKKALEFCSDTIFFKDSLRIRSVADLKRARVKISVEGNGEYKMFMKFRVDSLDRNYTTISIMELKDSVSGAIAYASSYWLMKSKEPSLMDLVLKTSTTKKKNNQLDARFISYGTTTLDKDIKTPRVNLDSMIITYSPILKVARERYLNHKLFADKSPLYEYTKNSGSLRDNGWAIVERDDNNAVATGRDSSDRK